jgi:signal transduction histidine kinase
MQAKSKFQLPTYISYLWQTTNDEFHKALLIKILQTTIALSFFGTLINFFIDLPLTLSLVGFATCGVFYVLLVLAQRNIHINTVRKTYISLCFVLLNLLWFANSGSDGSVLLMSVFFLVIFIFLTQGTEQKVIIAYYLFNITALFAVQVLSPDSITHYTSNTQRYIDNMIMVYIILICAIPLIIFIQKSYIIGRQKAEESERIKASFLANMSHEIRTPMNSILGFSELLSDSSLDDNEKDYYLDIIQTNGKVLLQLLNNIMEISKLDAHIVKPNLREVDIDNLLSQIHLSFKSDIEAKGGINFNVVPPINSERNAPLYTDELMVYQIISNLVSNAIKYTKQGSIEMGYQKMVAENKIVLFVKDTGIGIEPSKIKYIFNRFTQADDTYTRNYGGVGLGLSITEELVKLLNGSIKAESEVGKGSKFTIELPLKKFDIDHLILKHNWN